MTDEEAMMYKEWLKNFGRCLSEYRKKHGLTQKEAAMCAGMNKRFYSDIEYGLRPITTRTLIQLCTRFGIPFPYDGAIKFICRQ